MAETFKIASLKIDVDDVLKKSAQLKTQIDNLKATQKGLNTSTIEGQRAYTEAAAKLKNLNKSYNDSQKLAASLLTVNKDLEKTLQVENKTTQELFDSRRQLNEVAKNLKGDSEEEIALRTKVNKAIDEQTKQIRSQQSEFNSSKDKIGEYEQAINKAIPANSFLGKSIATTKDALNVVTPVYNKYKSLVSESVSDIRNAASSTEGLGKAQKVMAVATSIGSNALKLFRVALISTGIGAIVVALGSLVAFLGSTQKGINAVNSVLIPLRTVFESLFGLLQKVGETLFDAFSNPKKTIQQISDLVKSQLIDRFEGLKKILKGIFTFDLSSIKEGVDQTNKANKVITDGIKRTADVIGGTITDAIKRGQELAKLQAEYSRGEADYIVQVAKLKEEFKAQNKIAEDTNGTFEEREKAAKESIETQRKINALVNERLDQEIAILKNKQSNNDTSDAERAELAKLIAARNEANATALEAETTQNNKVNTIRKSAADAAKKRRDEELAAKKKLADEAIRLQEAELNLFIQQQGIKSKTLEEQLVTEKYLAAKSEEILRAKLENGNLIQEEYDAELLKIKNNLSTKLAEISVDNAQRELEAYISANQSKIDSEQYFSDESLRIEQERLDAIAEKRREFAQAQLEAGAINQIEYNDLINEINEENRIANEELKIERDEAEKEQKLIDAENQLAIDEANYQSQFALESARLEKKRLAEIANAKKTGADITLINQKYAVYQEEIDNAKSQAKVDNAATVFDGIAGLLDKESAAGKAVALAQAGINVAQGVTKAIADGGILGIITGAIVAATGAISIGKILNTKKPEKPSRGSTPTFARGGLLKGNSHSQGGIQTLFGELEGDEAVINKRSTAMFMPLLSAINEAGGGRRFADGGLLNNASISTPKSFIDYDLLASKLSDANRSLPNPIVGVDEISRVTNTVSVIESSASF
ncbi:hypothetical protein [Cochleicola gelatinilyticus]|uniref:Bacteriophage tail tape measure N-terminal domain-containing protein n=1 Tax=Cochleicola gelatinilyticus TaxID=1763537 RepID=A0A167HN68_9FLAO|nr:hypothetical protein [Cochleicola gelatinilyticus]OAB78790.1 hypothetical protein ULVI_09415 [Cochleicola gelatinilyticus]